MVLNENLNIPLKAIATNSASSVIKMVQPSPNNRNNETNKSEDQKKSFNFMDTFKPVYFVSRLLGLEPFSIIYDSNGDAQRPKITIFDGIWFVFSMGVYVMMAYSAEGIECRKESVERFTYILAYIFTIVGLTCSILTIAIDMCNRFKFVEILRKISIFDKEVSKFQAFLDYCNRNRISHIFYFVYADGKVGNPFQL